MKRTETHLKCKMTRRRFTGTLAAAATVSIVPRHVLGAGEKPPSEKLNIAGVGVGGMGRGNINACRGENIVVLCDVDERYAAGTFKDFPDTPNNPNPQDLPKTPERPLNDPLKDHPTRLR